MIFIHADLEPNFHEQIAHEFSLELEKRLKQDFAVIRFLPQRNYDGTRRNFRLVRDHAKVNGNCVSIRLVCKPTQEKYGTELARLDPWFYTSELVDNRFVRLIYDFLEFYGMCPRWCIKNSVSCGILDKFGIAAVTLDLGRYKTWKDACTIRGNFPKILNAMDRALHHYLDNRIEGDINA